MASYTEEEKLSGSLQEDQTLENKIIEQLEDTKRALEVIRNEPGMSLSDKWDIVSGLVRQRSDCRSCKKLISLYVKELLKTPPDQFEPMWSSIRPCLSSEELKLWTGHCNDGFPRYKGYLLLGPMENYSLRHFERRVIDNLEDPDRGVNSLQTTAEITPYEKWGSVAHLVRANPGCRELKELRNELVKILKKTSWFELRKLWMELCNELNEEERHLWVGPQPSEGLHSIVTIVTDITIAVSALHVTLLLSQDSENKLTTTSTMTLVYILLLWIVKKLMETSLA